MSFLSFLSSHRLHASHRPWIEPLNVRFDIIVHERPSEEGSRNPAVSPELSPNLLREMAPLAAEPSPPI